MVHAALLLLMLEAVTRTSFHHQPEAQHPKSLAIHKNAGRLPHLRVISRDMNRSNRDVRFYLDCVAKLSLRRSMNRDSVGGGDSRERSMMGRQERGQGQLFYVFDLDEVVPPDHLVRQIDAVFDLSWVHKEL